MNNLGLIVLLVAQILVLHVRAHEAQPPHPFEHGVQTGVQLHDQKNTDNKVAVSGLESKGAEAPQIRRLGRHHSTDKSVAGGGVIIGGLVTAIFAAVFCYIRVTRKRDTRY
ncbi:hypothetical protein Fmac_021737 [Flemingia macrophylla]|uniref:Transmembrane protein n=1 Tax=Flemingia macrophylla TaxID=520843 RepID=A0ABD1LZI8_9FABA